MTRRIERLNNLFRHEVSDLLQRQVKDPRLGNFIAITEVSISPDLRYAQIFVSHMGNEEERRETLSALAAASGFFRRELAKRIRVRHIPELSFQWDDSIERGTHLLELIDQVTSDSTPNQSSG
jgi:ribosome-binding factor A